MNNVKILYDNNITFQGNKKMLETTSNLSGKQINSEDIRAHHQFSLPLINNNKIKTQQEILSQHDSQSHDKYSYNRLQFPEIRKSRGGIDSPEGVFKKDQFFKKNKKQFAKEVKQKLDLVLGEMPKAVHISEDDGYGSEDFDFEAKINENKQLIKLHRIKKQNQNLSTSQAKNKEKQKQLKTKKQMQNRNQSLYEKRIRQYRDQSNQNKYLQKKKQFIKERQKSNNAKENGHFVGQSLKDLKMRDQYGSVKNQRMQVKKPQGKKSPTRILSQKSTPKQIFQIKQTATLFDGIQNFLQNPHENPKKQQKKPLIGLTLLKAKRDLQDKIKAINQKLGISSEQTPIRSEPRQINMQATAREWRRVEIKPQKIQSTLSNFEKEIDRVSFLQQKNSQCLEKYLQHQKILLQLQLRRIQLPRKDHANSH